MLQRTPLVTAQKKDFSEIVTLLEVPRLSADWGETRQLLPSWAMPLACPMLWINPPYGLNRALPSPIPLRASEATAGSL
jgi:hypothetical protein